MTSALLAALLVVLPSQEGPRVPDAAPPLVAVASFGTRDDGRPYLEIVATAYTLDQRKANAEEKKREKGDAKVLKAVQVVRRYLLEEGAMTVYDTDGKKVALKDLADRLAKPSVVLISADGKEVDPFHLRVARPGTLVIVSQAMADHRFLDAPDRNAPPPKE